MRQYGIGVFQPNSAQNLDNQDPNWMQSVGSDGGTKAN